MKKILALFLLVFLFFSCEQTDPLERATLTYTATDTSSTSRALEGGEVDLSKVYFRSSYITFYSIESLEDINTLDVDSGARIYFGDLEESILFEEGKTVISELTSDFILDVVKYNFIVIDAGDGIFHFVDNNGEFVAEGTLKNSEDLDDDAFICRSIVLVDNTILNNSIYISNSVFENYFNNGVLDITVDEADQEIVETIIENSGDERLFLVDSITPERYDVLLIPVNPIDLSMYRAIQTIDFEFEWEMLGCIYLENDEYYMTSRVGGSCFNFSISIEVEELLDGE